LVDEVTAAVWFGAVTHVETLVNRVAAEGHHRGGLPIEIERRKSGDRPGVTHELQVRPYCGAQIAVVEIPLSRDAWTS
jgi:hypothetical protein